MEKGISFTKVLLLCILNAASVSLFAQTRGPYLQMGTQTSITIRWRSATAADSKVELGTVYGTYDLSFTDATSTTEHIVSVTGLSPDTKYYYRVGNTTTMFSNSTLQFFTTLPLSTTTRKLRFAAFGDCGRNDNSFQTQTIARYTSYLTDNGIDAADAWLLLGDNAYSNGTDGQYTSGFFNAYNANILRNHKLYPAPGNHDYYSTNQSSRSGAYYQNFTMPANAECGGLASGTEAYYSFDIGNVHFLSLDSYGQENAGTTRLYDTTGAQVTWIKSDLAANTKKWTVAYWHHPPYTKGSHNSDTESELINIRENFIRILERNGVDMILCGHSHDYERSYLLKDYYKTNAGDPALTEADLDSDDHIVSNSSAEYISASTCPYVYNSGKEKHGTVYVVAGSSGADGGIQSGYPHNAFPFSQDDGGMLYFEVQNNRLDAKFIRRDGVIADKFTIIKDANKTTTYNVTVGSPVQLTASWPGTYAWNNAATTQSVSVTPVAEGTSNFSVEDAYGCLSDQFTVIATGVLSLKPPVNPPASQAKGQNSFQVKTISTNKSLVLQISSPYNSKCDLSIYDLSGRERRNIMMEISKGTSTKEVKIPPGIYIYEIRNDRGQKLAKKVMIL